MLNANSELAV